MLRLSRTFWELGRRVLIGGATRPQTAIHFLIHYRVRLSIVLCVSLVVAAVWRGIKPHDVTDWHNVFTLTGVGLILAGLALRTWAAGVLHKRDELTTCGPYQFVRHPLYVGTAAIMIGACTLIGDYLSAAAVCLFVAVVYTPQIRSEELALAGAFGDAWQVYADRTWRFVPCSLLRSPTANWRLSQWLKNREYEAGIAAGLGLAGLKLWSMLS